MSVQFVRTAAPIRRGSVLLLAVLFACSDSSGPAGPRGEGDDGSGPVRSGNCVIQGESLNFGGVGRDVIPALTNPEFVGASDPGAEYLLDHDRVIGFEWDGEAWAVPMNIMWWHEIVNLDGDEADLAVTYCPLTGTSLAFDRRRVGGAEFGVSGLLFRNNLVMFDRRTSESLWPQMMAEAGCGPSEGTDLTTFKVVETTWEGWRELHPDTRVTSDATGFSRNYERNPYEDYERLDAPPLFGMSEDRRRQPKERVLGIPDGLGGSLALPFLELEAHPRLAVNLSVGARTVVALWDRDKEAAMAYDAEPVWAEALDDPPMGPVNFGVEDGRVVDDATGSVWSVDGRAVSGPAAGSSLEPVPGSMVAFWFAWVSFNPDPEIVTEFQ